MNTNIIGFNAVYDDHYYRLEKMMSFLEQLDDRKISPEEKRTLRQTFCVEFNVTKRTLRNYMKKYRDNGLKSLVRKRRTDAGIDKAWKPVLLPKALSLFDENPYRSLKEVHEFLKNDKEVSEDAVKISTSCLYQRMKHAGVDFATIKSQKPAKTYRSFEAPFANVLWQSDARHGIWLPHPKDPKKKKRTYLFCWLDDYSRFVLYARYYYDEKLPTMEDAFRQAALRYGLPEKVYLDNGAAYVGKQFAIHLSELEVRKIHHPPYRAWCKGKIESQMKKFKKFQREAECAGCKTLDELNSALEAWIDIEHNRKIHSATGEAPADRYKKSLIKRPARYIADVREFEEIFYWRINRTVNKYGQIPLYKNKYHVPDIAAGTSISIRYNPFDLTEIFHYEDDKYVQTLKNKVLKRTQAPSIPEEKKVADHKVSKAASDYMARLREQHAENIRKTTNDISYRNINKDKNKNNEETND